MAYLINAGTLSEAWVKAIDLLSGAENGKAVHLNVAWTGGTTELPKVRAQLDGFLRTAGSANKRPYSVETVADTIFPEGFYHPRLGKKRALARLYELHEDRMRLHRRRDTRDRETYFNRLVNYPRGDGFNQLDYVLDRLSGKVGKVGSASSAYELGLSEPLDADLRIQAPGKDKNYYFFPCLSHISLTLSGRTINMAAIYRNQTYISRAYGNFLGLSRLAELLAEQTDAEVGEIQCMSTHADLEWTFGKRRVRELVANTQAALPEEMIADGR